MRVVEVYSRVISLFLARAEHNILFRTVELYPGTRARGYPAGSQRAEKRHLREC